MVHSVSAPARSPHFPLTYCRCGRRTLQQLVPILLTDQTSSKHIIPITSYQGRTTLATGETFQMKDMQRCSRLMWRWTSRFHDHLTGRNHLAARRTRSRISVQPAGTIRSIGSIKFLFSYWFGIIINEFIVIVYRGRMRCLVCHDEFRHISDELKPLPLGENWRTIEWWLRFLSMPTHIWNFSKPHF